MRKATRLMIMATITAAGSWAQTQVATVTSTSEFTLRGANVSTVQGVPGWPVLEGDTVNAGSTPATITLPDQSVLSLAPGSGARLTLSNGKVVFQVLSGSARYSLKSKSAVLFLANGHTFVPAALTGVLTSGGPQAGAAAAAAGWWTAGHTVAVVAASAAVAGTAAGVAATVNNGPAVSPSH